MSAGGSLAEAAAFLGIDHRYLKASPGSAALADDPAEFRLAVHALARQLSTTPGLINYKHRRDALQDWCIDPATWQDIISQLPPTKGPFQPELSDCKRQFASEAVWARITQGEHLLAPGSSRTSCQQETPPGTGAATTCGTSTTPARQNPTTPPSGRSSTPTRTTSPQPSTGNPNNTETHPGQSVRERHQLRTWLPTRSPMGRRARELIAEEVPARHAKLGAKCQTTCKVTAAATPSKSGKRHLSLGVTHARTAPAGDTSRVIATDQAADAAAERHA